MSTSEIFNVKKGNSLNRLLCVTLKDSDNQIVALDATWSAKLIVKENIDDDIYAIEKTMTIENNEFVGTLNATDTAQLEQGKYLMVILITNANKNYLQEVFYDLNIKQSALV